MEKPLEAFYKQPGGKHGRRADCKECRSEAFSRWRSENLWKARAATQEWAKAHKEELTEKARARYRAHRKARGLPLRGERVLVTEKRCGRCGNVKPNYEFGPRKQNRDGLQGTCRDCTRENKRRWTEENRDRVRAYNREWRMRTEAEKVREFAA